MYTQESFQESKLIHSSKAKQNPSLIFFYNKSDQDSELYNRLFKYHLLKHQNPMTTNKDLDDDVS